MTTPAIDPALETAKRHLEAFHALMQQVDDVLKTAPPDMPSQYIAEIGIAMALRAASTPEELRQFQVLWTLDAHKRRIELLAPSQSTPENLQ